MKHLFSLLLLLLTPALWGQDVEPIKLWPNNPKAGVVEVEVYLPEKSDKPTPAVLICPGGAYWIVAMNYEGREVAKWFASNGMAGIVLRYRTLVKGYHTYPLDDAEKAMSLIKEKATEWNIDTNHIGVIGSSAGGHLAASLCNLAKDENRPNFAILYYPVISFDNEITHMGSKKNLLGDKLINNQELVDRYSLEKQINDKTPKTLLLLSENDDVVSPLNSIRYYTALKAHNIPTSLYMFPTGGHGWGFNYKFEYYQEMKDLLRKWLIHIEVMEN